MILSYGTVEEFPLPPQSYLLVELNKGSGLERFFLHYINRTRIDLNKRMVSNSFITDLKQFKNFKLGSIM